MNFKEKILIILLKFANILFFINQSLYLKCYIFFKRKKEKKILALFQKIINPSMNVVDVGANVGFFSEIFCQLARKGIVYSVEPNSSLLSFLRSISKKYSNLEIINAAFGKHVDIQNVNFYPSKLLNIDGRTYNNRFSSHKSIIVKSMRFDTFFENKKIDFVKIDVQGFEGDVLSGMGEILKQKIIIYLEFWPAAIIELGSNPEDVLLILEKNQFIIRLIKPGFPILDSKNWRKYFPDISYFSDSNLICYKQDHSSQILDALRTQC
jgi:FkbM family methyltransferase